MTKSAFQVRRWSCIGAAFFLGFLLAALCFVTLAFDQASGSYEAWRHYVTFIAVSSGISAIMYMRYRLRITICTGAGFLVSLLVLHYCDATPAKAFRRLDAAIHDGMTLADVRSALQREFPKRGRFPVPVLFESGTQMGDEVVFSSDRQDVHIMAFAFDIFVSFHKGRVVEKHSHFLGSDWDLPTTFVLLAAFACLFCWWCARRIAAVKAQAGHGIDAASVAERLRCVRRDYHGEYRTRRHFACQRRDLLASAGEAVRRFPYFRGRALESSEDSEDERGNS